jgi:diketogulonate reductase-like aldo/keto reductase
MYENEKEVGEAIAAKIKDGTVSRDQLYIVSKVSKLQPHAQEKFNNFQH